MGMLRGSTRGYLVPAQKAISFTQAAPVQNTYYEALNVTNAKLLAIAAGITATGETLQIRITIDGNVWTGTATACNAAEFVAVDYLRGSTSGIIMIASNANWDLKERPAYMNTTVGQNILIEVRKTTAVGVGDLLLVGYYQQW